MSSEKVPASLRAPVAERAGWRCEYCHMPEGVGLWPHEADHVIPAQHGGRTELENLALACFHCNRRKGPNLASLDPATGDLAPLFNPRVHRWTDHFRWEGPRIEPLSDIGRVTAQLLRLNAPERVLVRQALRRAGRW